MDISDIVSPVPLSSLISVSQSTGPDGTVWVLIQVSDPGGVKFTMLTGQQARGLAELLLEVADASAANLILPPGNGHGHA